MRRRIIAFLGILSPLLLLFVCAFILVLGAGLGWWFLSTEGQERLIRVIPLAPLSTPATDRPQQDLAGQSGPEQAPSPNENSEAGVAQAGQVDPDNNEETAAPASPEQIEQALGFAVPDGSVNSVTQEGVANRLVIPRLKLDAPIVLSPIENQTWKVDHLGQSVGHLEGTAPPGSNSNLVLAAHVTLSAGVYGPFAGLSQLAPGDVVYVHNAGKQYEYVIDGYQIVDRTAINVTHPTQTGQITLITCSNWDHNQNRYIDRLVVTGHLNKG